MCILSHHLIVPKARYLGNSLNENEKNIHDVFEGHQEALGR